MKYVHVQKIRYALEIPENACRNLDDDYELMNSRKGFKRYYTSELRELLDELTASEKKKELALKDTTSGLFRHFDGHHDTFQRVLHCLSTLDVILSSLLIANPMQICVDRWFFKLKMINNHLSIFMMENIRVCFKKRQIHSFQMILFLLIRLITKKNILDQNFLFLLVIK